MDCEDDHNYDVDTALIQDSSSPGNVWHCARGTSTEHMFIHQRKRRLASVGFREDRHETDLKLPQLRQRGDLVNAETIEGTTKKG